jgi:signal transduction histidine kinase
VESYIFPLITCCVILTIIAITVPLKYDIKSYQKLLLLCSTTLWWHGSWFFLFLEREKTQAESIARFGHIGIILLPVSYRVYVSELLDKKSKYDTFLWFISILFLVPLFSGSLVTGVRGHEWGFYPVAGPLHPLFMIVIFLVLCWTIFDLMKSWYDEKDLKKKNVILFVAIACASFCVGAWDFLINYGIYDGYPPSFISTIFFMVMNAIGVIGLEMFQSRNVLRTAIVENTSLLQEVTLLESDLDHAKAALIQKEKMASIGLLASGIAHQLGNTLNSISVANFALAKNMEISNESNQKYLACVKRIRESVEISGEIILSLNSMGKENHVFKTQTLRPIVFSAIVLSKGKFFESLSVENDVSEITNVYCSKSGLTQVLMNLISNAADAVSEHSGRIAISAKMETDCTLIEVKDNGAGIPEAVKSRLFEPFVTSKSSEEGTGLGLYMVKKIIDEHLGKISVQSDNQGTRFILSLPRGKENE